MNPFKPWRTRVSTALTLLTAIGLGTAHAAGPGEAKFNSICAACHTIGEGRRVGPDLLASPSGAAKVAPQVHQIIAVGGGVGRSGRREALRGVQQDADARHAAVQ
ncbi:MAG: hypothetical protein IPK07_20395 [Deltaproteobacteria bacterium]|nr:hypothetical protein [Deltaproteobacteria bacterium]